MKKQVPFYILMVLLLCGAVGCSTTKNLPEGEQLYVGIGKTKIINEDGSSAGQRALSAAESAINVKPNNSLFGSPYENTLPFWSVGVQSLCKRLYGIR